MGVQLHKASHLVWFVIILPGLSVLLAWCGSQIVSDVVPTDLLFLVDSVGILGAFGLLYKGFDLWAWRWPMFRLVRIVEAPTVEVRWIGKLKSSRDGHTTDHDAALEIKQSFSRVKVAMYFATSCSSSLVAGFVEEPNGTLALHYEYQNVPAIDATATMHIHHGTAKLHCVPGQPRLEGEYYNWGRDDRGNVGKMDFQFEGKAVLHRLKT